jgi:hypothetical protein
MTTRKLLTGGGLLIGLYLAVAYATGTGRVIDASTRGGVGIIRAFQGR